MDKDKSKATDLNGSSFLNGQFLIAMPSMKDPRFARAVILLCAHSKEGAMGIIVNQPSGEISFGDLLGQLEIVGDEELAPLADELAIKPVHVGGPVESSRGFVLHSADYNMSEATLPIQPGVCLTATVDILRAIANNEGPEHSFLALGYAGWAPGQLEDELASNGWLNCAIDADLVFQNGLGDKYTQALGLLGIDLSFLAAEAGHA